MNCKFHVGVAMLASEQRIPFDSDLSDFTRTVLRCPVAQCSVVAMIYDEEKIDVRACGVCGRAIKDGDTMASLSDVRCNSCKNGKRWRYRRGHQPKRGAWKHNVTRLERAKRGSRMRAAKKVGRHAL
jgi:hypothetical protein